MTANKDTDGWAKNEKLIMHELQRINDNYEKADAKLDDNYEKTNDKLNEISKKLAVLEVKSSLLGAVSGAVTSGVAMAIFFLKGLFSKG